MHFCFIVGGDGIYSVACWDVSQFVDNAHLLHLYDDGIHLHSIKVNLTMSRFCGVVLVNAETRLGVWTTFELPSYALTRLAAAGRPETFLYSPLDGFRCALSCTIFNNLLTCILGRVKYTKNLIRPLKATIWVRKMSPKSLGALSQVWPLRKLAFLKTPVLLSKVPWNAL